MDKYRGYNALAVAIILQAISDYKRKQGPMDARGFLEDVAPVWMDDMLDEFPQERWRDWVRGGCKGKFPRRVFAGFHGEA